ncbi:MAG TPA: PQQ-binding-like beta-propeller repeat protein [Bryobacteraceae bacterium]|nr:PQQ-binding-like beta-propeller repeat protein [Bryobacteraceae bacterium]
MRVFSICLLSMAAAVAAEPNWPQFRGPSASGLGEGSPPTEWNIESGKNIRWKTEIPGLGHSSPVIWGDRVFVTSAVPASGESKLKVGLYGDIAPVKGEPAQSFNVYCLDRRSGKILWQRAAASGPPKIMRHPKSTHANPTPATDGKRLVVFFGSEGLFTYDLKGKLLWKKDFGVLDSGFYMVPAAQWGFASSPVIHGNMVIIQADVQKNSFLAAFDIKSGKELWRTPRSDVPTFGSPAVVPYTGTGASGWQVVVNGWKHIGGYDLKTGKELWSLKGGGDIPVPTPVFGDGLVVVTNAHGRGRPIFAIHTDAAGDITGSKSAIAWTEPRGGNYMQTPLIAGDLGYFCFDAGILSVYKMATGERQYQQRLGGGTSGFTSSAVAAGGHLYITNEEGHSYVLALGSEYKLIAENDLGETVMATPAIADGVLYMRGGKHLVAIGEKP